MSLRASYLLPAALLVVAAPGRAGEFGTLKDEIAAARQALVTMVLHRDKRGPEQQKLVKDTADLVTSHLGKVKAPAEQAAAFKELKDTWSAFKATREKELVPAILAGDKAKYERIGAGIQKARLDRMYALLAQLDK